MSTPSSRDEIRKIHPVHLRNIIYPTDASEKLLMQLESAVLTRSRGIVVLSKPSMGLTTAIRLAAEGWPMLHPDTPMVVIRATGRGKFVPREFWASLITQTAPNLASDSNPEVLRHRLLLNFTTRAIAHGADRLLLVIDCAHQMRTEELTQIAMFQDDLADDGINLVVVLAGYEQLKTLREDLHREGREEPVRRYFEHEHSFFGMRYAYDFQYFLESFDEDRFPAGSEWPISRFYFRDMFDRGWRLGQESSRAWSIFECFAGTDGEAIEIEMPYITRTVCTLFESAYDRGFVALSPDGEAWKAAVQSSGLIESRLMTAQFAAQKAVKGHHAFSSKT